MSRTLEHLERLVAFDVLPGQNNTRIVDYIYQTLAEAGARIWRIDDPENDGKSGLFACIGPEGPGGVMLSGHLDVVTVDGQAWRSDPFRLHRKDGKAYGRGAADMKGFLAAMLTVAQTAGQKRLMRPLKFAFSWDEEIGCKGIPVMLDQIEGSVGAPDMCIVGEPTEMRCVVAHKGKTALRATCKGEAGHSADAPLYQNALHRAAEFIAALRAEQARLAREGARDEGYGVPYSTVHAGLMRGGAALNLVPDFAEVVFEIRTLAGEPPEAIIARLQQAAAEIGGVEIEITGGYPGLGTPVESAAVAFMQAILAHGVPGHVSFGTEAGHFAARGIDTVVCGPGSMAQGHKADEFVTFEQLDQCDSMLRDVLRELSEKIK